MSEKEIERKRDERVHNFYLELFSSNFADNRRKLQNRNRMIDRDGIERKRNEREKESQREYINKSLP